MGKEPKPAIMSVYIQKIARDDREPLMKYDPSHPDANSEGYVAYPNVNPVVEMANLIKATRAYSSECCSVSKCKKYGE